MTAILMIISIDTVYMYTENIKLVSENKGNRVTNKKCLEVWYYCPSPREHIRSLREIDMYLHGERISIIF